MKVIFPVIISTEKTEQYHDVFVPDLEINTEGVDIADSIGMARDAIGLKCITMEDMDLEIPSPSDIKDISFGKGEFVTLVDVDPLKKIALFQAGCAMKPKRPTSIFPPFCKPPSSVNFISTEKDAKNPTVAFVTAG